MRKIFAILLVLAMIFVTGCGEDSGGNISSKGKVIGVAMPTQLAQRWIQDGDYIKSKLENKGYEVDLKYAEDNIKTQIDQIDEMIESHVSCLVVAAIDSAELVNVLEKARQKNIPVIAYDRLLMNTNSVSYYATFDNKGVGVLIGRYIETQLDLKNSDKTFNIEFFAGSPDDNNAHFLNNGVFEVLQPYIYDGKIKILSGQTEFNSICTLRWSRETAKKRMDDILKNYYQNQKLDAVVSPYDGITYGIIDALESAGYTKENWPLITGQDADLQAIKNILNDKQTMTIFKDTRVLADKCVTMVEAVLEGKVPEINDTISYDNHKMIVPSFLCTPVVVDKNNIDKELIESGYYTKKEIYN